MAEICVHCDEEILQGDEMTTAHEVTRIRRLVAEKRFAHHECMARIAVGSVGHQMKRCSCYGGTEEDPPGMTKRQAAIAAYELFQNSHASPGVAS